MNQGLVDSLYERKEANVADTWQVIGSIEHLSRKELQSITIGQARLTVIVKDGEFSVLPLGDGALKGVTLPALRTTGTFTGAPGKANRVLRNTKFPYSGPSSGGYRAARRASLS
jgi:hypothetical protein